MSEIFTKIRESYSKTLKHLETAGLPEDTLKEIKGQVEQVYEALKQNQGKLYLRTKEGVERMKKISQAISHLEDTAGKLFQKKSQDIASFENELAEIEKQEEELVNEIKDRVLRVT